MKPTINFCLIFGAIMTGIMLFWPNVVLDVVYPALKMLNLVD